MIKSHRIQILAWAVLLALSGCSGKGPRADRSVDAPPFYEPVPGVDSSVVARAFQAADTLFVTSEEEEAAAGLLRESKKEFASSDTLYSLKKVIEMAGDSTIQVTAEDSAKAIEYLNQAYGSYQKAEKLFERYQADPSAADLGGKIIDHLEKARSTTVLSIRHNPFDMDARLLLSVIYRYLARVMGDEENYGIAARILEELIQMDRGESSLYYELAYDYFSIKDWENALTNFERAEELLYEDETIDFENHGTPREQGTGRRDSSAAPAAVDTSLLLTYVWYQAECLTKLYRSPEALDTYERARTFSRSEEDQKAISEKIKWIEWDGGDIRNVETRDSLYREESAGDYESARSGYLDLLARLTSPPAIDEIEWKVATIDYVNVGDKERGIVRLKKVIDRAVERGVLDLEGRLGDPNSLYPTYLENYGTMCFNLGIDRLDQKKRREAFAYFLQSSRVKWQNRGSSFVELLKLARNNPGMTIEYGEKALENDLSPEERTYVLKQLVTAYKRKGSHQDFEKARRYFNEWKNLVE